MKTRNLLLFGIFLLLVVGFSNSVNATWNTSFIYSATITSDQSANRNESITFYMSEISGWARTQVLSNCNDIRIVNASDNEQLYYYVDICNSTDIRIGFLNKYNVSGVIAKVYWNYSEAEPQNKSMRMFYDDFNDNSLDTAIWALTQGNTSYHISEEGGVLNQTDNMIGTNEISLFWYKNTTALQYEKVYAKFTPSTSPPNNDYGHGISLGIRNTTTNDAREFVRRYTTATTTQVQWLDTNVAWGGSSANFPFQLNTWVWMSASADDGVNPDRGKVWNITDNEPSSDTLTQSSTARPGWFGLALGASAIASWDEFQIWAVGYNPTFYATSSTVTLGSSTSPLATNTSLWLNDIEGNIQCTYPCTLNATAIVNTTGLNVAIYKNGTLIANGTTTTYNSTQWSAGIYEITASTTGNSTYDSSSVTYYATINKGTPALSLSSSAGWNIAQTTSTTITCSGDGNPTLSIDAIIVSNPYTATLSIGIHTLICDITDTQNYTYTSSTQNLLVSALISCIDTNTFGFSKNFTISENITTLDFTGVVLQNYVKDDLSDVFVNISNYSSNVWKNTTGGYYIIVNTTGLSSMNVYFGNYIANYSYDYSNFTNATAISNYSQTNPAILINIVDEMTGNPLYPPSSSLYLITSCSLGSDYIPIYNFTNISTKVFLPGKSTYDTITLRVKYTADMYYSRQIITSGITYGSINIYVVDAYLNALDRIDFHMIDSINYNARFQIYKLIQSTPVIITEGYFDASHYFSGYLMEDTEYQLRTILTGAYTDYGIMNVVTPTTKDLSIGKISLNPDALLIADHIKMNAWWSYNKTFINIEYLDDTNLTQQLNITIEFANGTIFNTTSYANISSIILTYNVTDYPNDEFYIKFSIHHSIFGNSPVEFGLSLLRDFSRFMNAIPAVWKQLLSIFFVLMAQGIVTRRNLLFGTILTLGLIVMMWGIGWLQISYAFLTMAFFLGIIGIVAYQKQGGE